MEKKTAKKTVDNIEPATKTSVENTAPEHIESGKPAHEHVEHHESANSTHEHAEHHHIPVKKNNSGFYRMIAMALMVLLVILLAYNQILIMGVYSQISDKTTELAEASRAANIQLLAINDKECPDCFSTAALEASIKKLNVNVTNEKSLDYQSPEAQSLINQYNIKSVPTLIVTGETNKSSIPGFTLSQNAAVYSQQEAPYRDLVSGQIKGRVTVNFINATNCSKCSNMYLLLDQLKQVGIKIYKVNMIDSGTEEAKGLLSKYNISKIPAVTLSTDAQYYTAIQAWPQVGTIDKDGTYVLRTVSPPYVDNQGKIRGISNVTLLNDSSCTKCYQVSDHIQVLKLSYGFFIDSTKTVDVNSQEGKDLIKKYNITKIPTVLFTEGSAYEELQQSWAILGSIEKDGVYIFRNLDLWPGHPYKNLANNTFVPNAATAS